MLSNLAKEGLLPSSAQFKSQLSSALGGEKNVNKSNHPPTTIQISRFLLDFILSSKRKCVYVGRPKNILIQKLPTKLSRNTNPSLT